MPILTPELKHYLDNCAPQTSKIENGRKALLDKMAKHFRSDKAGAKTWLFVCTHNSRRSQMAQAMWLAVTEYYNLGEIGAYSAGTQQTALHFYALMALEHAGFQFLKSKEGKNPHYALLDNTNQEVKLLYSKTLEDSSLPQEEFTAIMVCDHADANCPFVPGAGARFGLHYSDPKAYDSSPDPLQHYDDTLCQITHELLYIASRV